jgi:pimeloyl-ACP methyl ester carboxylesterase
MNRQIIKTPAGRRIAYTEAPSTEAGSRPAVLLIHGWPSSSIMWATVWPALTSAGYRVIALDLPGFGASDKPDLRYDFPVFAEAIGAVLAHAGVERVSLVGHDLGGPVAAHWALHHPDRVTSLGFLNTLLYPEFDPSVFEFVRALIDPDSRDHMVSPAGLTEFLRTGVTEPDALPPDFVAAVTRAHSSDTERRILAKTAIGLSIEGFEAIRDQLPHLGFPLFAVVGERDRVLPDITRTMTRLAADVPAARIDVLPDAGHFVSIEEPALVGALLAENLDAAHDQSPSRID